MFFKVNQDVSKKERDVIWARSNSFIYESDAEHQIGGQYSKQGKINA